VVEDARTGGKAVVARHEILRGDVVAVWSGRILNYEQIRGLPEAFRAHTAQVEEGLYLTSITPNEAPDYINHSCEPNAGMSGQLVIVAMRDIAAGEEITIDYAMCDGSAFDEFPCACGSRFCRGEVTGNDWRRPELWSRYGAHFSPYLLRRIAALRALEHTVRVTVANGYHADA
jgi:hypothetical protein